MAIAFDRSPWAAPLVLVAVLLMALAPETADAHGGYGHVTPPTHAPGNDASAPGFGAASAPASSASPFCPGGSGHTCECAEPLALVRVPKTFTFHYSSWNPPVRPHVERIKLPALGAPAPSAPLLSPASPRAPPLYS